MARLRRESQELRSEVTTLRAQLNGLRALMPTLGGGSWRGECVRRGGRGAGGGAGGGRRWGGGGVGGDTCVEEDDDALLLRLKNAAQHEFDEADEELAMDGGGEMAAASAALAAEATVADQATYVPRRASKSSNSDRFRGLSLLGSMLTPNDDGLQAAFSAPDVTAATTAKEKEQKQEEQYTDNGGGSTAADDLLHRLQEEALQEVDATAAFAKEARFGSAGHGGGVHDARSRSSSRASARSRARTGSDGGLRGLSLLGNFLDPYASRDVDGLLGVNMNHGAIPIIVRPTVSNKT